MGRWQIGLSTNPLIAYYAAAAVRSIWGDHHGQNHMAIKSFLDAGTWVALGTDSPVVPADWKSGLQFAITRVGIDREPNGPEYAINIMDGLAAHTRAAAYQDHQENIKGTIEVGKFADLAVFDQNFRRIPPETFSEVNTLLTIVNGQIVFDTFQSIAH